MIGGGFDGSYYYDEGQREHHLEPRRRHARCPGITYDNVTNVMKKLGAKKIGVGRLRRVAVVERVGQGHVRRTRRRPSGLEPVYLNTSVDFGTTDVGPIVLGIKNSGADACTCRSTPTRTSPSCRASSRTACP